MKSLKRKCKRVRPLLGTFVEIELAGAASVPFLQECISVGFEAVAEVDHLMSPHRKDSDLSRLNQAPAGKWLDVDPLTVAVLLTAKDLYRMSDGLFDIRCGPAPRSAAFPLDIRGHRARKTDTFTMDLGGIAKGFAVDRAVQAIQRRAPGFSGIVNAGGDLRVWGAPVPTSIRLPEGTPMLSFPLRNSAAATSSVRRADAFPWTEAAHVRHGHLFRQRKTVTVFADHCMTADALTKIVLMGPPATARRCLSSHRARALIFGSDGQLDKILTS